MAIQDPSSLHAVVDMGSNGIRLSITSTKTRHLPGLYHSRAAISLYDAQFPPGSSTSTRQPIPDATIQRVLTTFQHFKTTCADFNVPPGNIHVLATEATRTAPNSLHFRERIRDVTGWEVCMLEKETEGRIGAMGVVASSGTGTEGMGGLVMDLGGGSTQLTWVVAEPDGNVRISSRGSVSLPYGAAALKGRLEGVDSKGREAVKGEMVQSFQQAHRDLDVPGELKEGGGLDLYLCGGGFRGWGYLLMERAAVNPYPIPIINGYRVRKEEFHDTAAVLETVAGSEVKVFGVSKRRASQIPAVAFLVNVLVDALPEIQNIQFCQGGVREGFLFDRLPAEIRAEHPLLAATRPYATPSANVFQHLLASALPVSAPASFSPQLLSALANLLYVHSCVPKESRCAAALHSTTSGVLASTNNLTHLDRALLALTLCERWDGELAPTDQSLFTRLRRYVSAAEAWWSQYLGRVGTLIGDVYPAGQIDIKDKHRWRISLHAQLDVAKGGKEKDQGLLRLVVKWNPDVVMLDAVLEGHRERIEKPGKRKKWVDGYGVAVECLLNT